MINPELLSFFEDLKDNNNRDWFNARKSTFKRLKSEFEAFMDDVAMQVAEVDPLIDEHFEAPNTTKVFRIYRDVRFSNNKDPYKTNIGGRICAGEAYPSYYLHIEPGKSFAGGGFYMPSKTALARVRDKICDDQEAFESLLSDDAFISVFPNGLSVMGDELKTAPRGYDKDHAAVHWLRFKHYVVTRPLTDEEVVSEDFEAKLVELFEVLSGFNSYLIEEI